MLLILLSSLAVLMLDLAVKRSVELRGGARLLRLGPFAQIRHVASSRPFYCLPAFRLLLVLVWTAALAAAVTLAGTGVLSSGAARIAMGAALGGAAGNLFDILRSRSVRDYIDLGWWPVFNLADVAILGGLALAFLQR